MRPLRTQLARFSLALLVMTAVKGRPGTVYQNSFSGGATTLSGLTTFTQNPGSASVAQGQLELYSEWSGSRVGVSLNTGSLSNYSNTLSGNSDIVEWAFNVSNADALSNNGFFFVPAMDSENPFGSVRGYALRGGGLGGNRMYLTRFDLILNGPETILIDVPDALGLGPLPQMGAVRITFQPSSGTWSLYLDKSLAYTDPRATTNLVGSAVDDTYTHAPLPYVSMGGEGNGTDYFDNVSITVGSASPPAIPQTISFSLPSEVVITNSPLTLTATASSGLPVTFEVLSGPATLEGDHLVLTATGQVTVQAEQGGSSQYQPVAVLQTFSVTAPVDGSVAIVKGPVINPRNNHQYYLLSPKDWTNAELAAVAMGGHLVTINSQDENYWVNSTFGSLIDGDLWIGLHLPDPSAASTNLVTRSTEFVWASGQPVTVELWAATNTTRSGYCKLHGPNYDPQFERGNWAEELEQTPLNSVVEVPTPLEIAVQPQNTSAGIGSVATISVVADGTTPISYQWQRNGTNLPGQTAATLFLTNAQPSQAASFSVVVSNASGTLTSAPALFSVVGIVAWGPSGVLDGQLNIPPDLTSVQAIAAGNSHYLALRTDGTVVAWGDNRYNQLSVPAGLTNVIAIAGAEYHSLALKADGTVVSWGYDLRTGNWVPWDLTNVVAIDADGYHNLALKADGTVVAWGGDGALPSVAPSGLSNVVAISAGGGHNLALKADGSVVKWWDTSGQLLDVPDGLTNIIAISEGEGDSFALKADGTVVAWGMDLNHQAEVPAGLTNVVAISGKSFRSLALRADGTVVSWGVTSVPAGLPNVVAVASTFNDTIALLRDGAPNMTVQPWDRSIPQGDSPSLVAKAVGVQAMTYQWQRDGTNIAGATSDTYNITNAQPVHAGVYTLKVSNEVGQLASRHAKLLVSPAVSIQTNHPIIAWNNPGTITYGTPLGSAQLNALADVPGTFAYSPAFGTVLPAGNNQSLNVSFTPLDLVNYTPASTTVKISVLPAPLSVTADNTNRAYGNVNPLFSATISGLVNGDTTAVLNGAPSFSTAASSKSPVGTYTIVPSIGTLTVNANYTFADFGNATLTVYPANLAVNATGVSKIYDSTAAATVLLADDRISGDNLTETYGSAVFSDPNVGTSKLVTVSGISLMGPDAANYTFNLTTTAMANITQATLTVNSGLSANNKAYDGTTTATLSSNNVTMGGVMNADAAHLWLVTNGYTASFASEAVGNNLAVTVGGLTLGGAASSNYALAQPSGLTASITAPEPRLVATSLVGHTLQLSVPTVIGVKYVLEYKNSMTEPNWAAGPTSAGNGGIVKFTDEVATNATGFYRVRIQ